MYFATGFGVINDSAQAETCRGSFFHMSLVSLSDVALIRSMKQIFLLIFVSFILMSLLFAKTIVKFPFYFSMQSDVETEFKIIEFSELKSLLISNVEFLGPASFNKT